MDRQTVSSGAPWEAVVGYARAVRVGPFVSVAGTTAMRPDGSVVGGAEAQTRAALETIAEALEQASASLHDVVRTRIFRDRHRAVGSRRPCPRRRLW